MHLSRGRRTQIGQFLCYFKLFGGVGGRKPAFSLVLQRRARGRARGEARGRGRAGARIGPPYGAMRSMATVAGYSGYGSSPRDSPSISPATVAERGLGHHNDENNNGAAFGGAHRALPRPVVLLFSSL